MVNVEARPRKAGLKGLCGVISPSILSLLHAGWLFVWPAFSHCGSVCWKEVRYSQGMRLWWGITAWRMFTQQSARRVLSGSLNGKWVAFSDLWSLKSLSTNIPPIIHTIIHRRGVNHARQGRVRHLTPGHQHLTRRSQELNQQPFGCLAT